MRLMLIGDSIGETTGFARVLREIAIYAGTLGWDVAQIASNDGPPFCDTTQFRLYGVTPYWPDGKDPLGRSVAAESIAHFRPDVLLINADPGTVRFWQKALEEHAPDVPTVVYAPVEGAPIASGYAESFRRATRAYTYTAWSRNALKEEHDLDIPYVYHGVDTDAFAPLGAEERAHWREQLGWTDQYIVAYVARNSERKQHPRLIQALAHLKGGSDLDDDVRLYLHCRPFDTHWMRGWDLDEVARWCGVRDRIYFPGQEKATHGESDASLAIKLGCADLYVHVSQIEGFGLPILEAMAAGTPVMIPADFGTMMEVVGAYGTENGIHVGAAAGVIRVADTQTAFNGAQVYNLNPVTIAQAIYMFRRQDEAERIKPVHVGRKWVTSGRFDWTAMAKVLTEEGCMSAVYGDMVESARALEGVAG